MKFDDDQNREWDELEFDDFDTEEEKDTSVEDQVDEAVQKLVRETMGNVSGNPYVSGDEDDGSGDAEDESGNEDKIGNEEDLFGSGDTEDEYEDDADDEYEDDDDDYDDYDDDDDDKPRRKGGKKGLIIFGIVAALAVVLLVGFYGYRAYYFTGHFFEGTTIDGMDCGGMTAAQVENRIAEGAKNYTLNIHFRNGDQEIQGSSIDYSYQPDGSVEKLLKEQNAFAWLTENLKSKKHEDSVKMQYDAAKLDEQVSQFQQLQADQMQAPVSAGLEFQNGKFVVNAASEGTQLDVEKAKEAISDAVSRGISELDMEETGVYTEPETSASETDLETQADQLNELVSASITYQLPNGQTQVLDGNTLKDWLSVDENGSYTKNDEIWNQKLNEYVANLAAAVDTYGKEHTFPATGIDGGVQVTQADYGWKIDQEQEAAQLTQDISNHLTTTREPVYSSREFSSDNYGFGNTYVEVDVSRQHIWYYKDGNRIVDSDCVTGKMVQSRYTPAGIFTLVSKTSPKTLRGPQLSDGSYEWESDVTYWMPFNGGIGLHDATWRSSFGGNIYKNNGSHGCVNLPYNVAKEIYENIEVGTPVIVYYSEAYSVTDDSAEREAQNLPTSAAVTDTDTPTSTPAPTTSHSRPTSRPTQTPSETTPEPTQAPTITTTPEPTTPEPTETPSETTPEPTQTPEPTETPSVPETTPEPTEPSEPEPPAENSDSSSDVQQPSSESTAEE